INYQEKNKDVLVELWRGWFDPILNSLSGEVMDNYDDSGIYALCREKLWTQGTKRALSLRIKQDLCSSSLAQGYSIFDDVCFVPFGRVSYTKANNAFNFYQLLKLNDWSDVNARYSKAQFLNLVKCLVDVGVPK